MTTDSPLRVRSKLRRWGWAIQRRTRAQNQGGQHQDGEDFQIDVVHQDAGFSEDGLAERVPD